CRSGRTHCGSWCPVSSIDTRSGTPGGQLLLPTPRQPPSSSTTRVLPMQLKVGDRLADETGEWEVTVRSYTSPGGKNVRARVRRVDQPATAEERTWGAHERINVKRA